MIATTVAFLAGGKAAAQEADHVDRGDVADFRLHEEDGEPEPYLLDADGRAIPTWSIGAGAPILFDSNPFWASDGSEAALLAAPALTVTYSHPRLVPGWDLELSAGADADMFSHDADELNEARLNASATLFHRLGEAGTLSFGFRARWSYVGENFGDFDQSQQRYVVQFASRLSDGIGVSAAAEYRDSTQPGQRRFIGTANADWTMAETEDLRLVFFQEFAFSSFTSGANEGRDDLLSLSELLLSPILGLPRGVSLGLAATLFHRFSNRAASRFTAVQFGPSLRFRF